ncbi:MAG: hypothetical protein JSS54_15820 [Proteobacteria bacterium]|nr:hypothetical protein [Pseudomonadota bacterium]
MSSTRGMFQLICVATLAALVSVSPSIAGDNTGATSSQPLFIDQRRLPEGTDKQSGTAPSGDADELRKAEEQKKLDEMAAKLKAEEEELAAREAEARKKIEELQRLSDQAEVKHKEDEDRLLAREAEAQKKVEESKRLADEARAKLQAELEKQATSKPEPSVSTSGTAQPATDGAPVDHDPVKNDQPTPHADLNIPAIALTCPDPIVSAQPLPGGRSKVTVQSPCRHGEDVSLQYGPIAIRRTLDDQGAAELIADMFLGSDAETSVSFADGKQQHLQLAAGDLAEVTKVAIVWDAPVNLDLHAIEYAAAIGEPGDVWSGAPRDAAISAALVARDGRGHGFMSSTDDGKGAGPKAEVFTFWQKKGQARGAIAMVLDYETRGSAPGGETCGNGRYAQVSVEIIERAIDGAISRQNGLIPSAPCGVALSTAARYQSGVIPDLRIHNAN